MEGTKVASTYAKSLIDLSTEQNVLEQAYADMKYILEVNKSDRAFESFLKSPIIKTDKKIAVLKEIFGGKVNKVSEAFILLIANKKREVYLTDIAKQFIEQYKEKKKILTAVITTANGIDDTIRKKVMEIVKGVSSSEVMLEEKIDKDVIGGFIIRIGDKQVDATIARKLNNLKRSFNESPFNKDFGKN